MPCLLGLATLMASFLAVPVAASATVIIIDPSQTTGVNSITPVAGNPLGSPLSINQLNTVGGGLGQSIADLADIDGNATGFSAEITTAFAALSNGGYWPTTGSDAAIFRGSPAGNDMGIDSGVNNAPSVITLSGLDLSMAYTFTFYAARGGSTADLSTLMTVTGANTGSADVDAANNQTTVGIVSGISPNTSQEITITFDRGAGNTSYFYANAIQMEIIPIPEPASVAMLAFGTVILLVARRRRN